VLGLNLMRVLVLGPLVLGVHVVAFALAKALRTYSRIRLEAVCAARGHAHRSDEVAHLDEATELGAQAVADISGLLLALMLGVVLALSEATPGNLGLVGGASVLCILAHFLAGAVGQVYAESVIDRLWPGALLIRMLTAPLSHIRQACAEAVVLPAWPESAPARPASVEVEIPSTGETPEVVDADLPDSVRALMQEAVTLTLRDVSELMTPRSAMVTLAASISAAAAVRTFRETGKSRIPLFGENRDDIVGILYAKDLFPRMTDPAAPGAVVPRALVRPAHCVPRTKNAYELLQEFRSQRTQIAIVLDEYGGVAGLITLEDLLEELVGAIEDEHDKPSSVDPLIELGDARFEVDATVELQYLNQRLGLHLRTDGDYLTVGGLALDAMGRVPEPGAVFRHAGIDFTVVEVADHAIRRVRLDLQPSAAVGSQ
jgi:CBS domain containing-hemolysin-like protein